MWKLLGTLALGLTAYQGMVSVKEEDDDSDNHLLKRPSKKPKKAVTQSKPVSGKAGTHPKCQSASTVRYTTSCDGIHTHVHCPQLAAFTPRPCARSLHSPLPRSRSLRKRRLPLLWRSILIEMTWMRTGATEAAITKGFRLRRYVFLAAHAHVLVLN